ncbi:uncharacterized protein LOC130667586 [Microplitis mediator]|uniref:uncharacterized protein LOC130667586 n=1 Tax=Microplitis mediator TaxID=375433 RepID=UPI00255673D9|nr:uncharacterized protein LOC130667586 [Microplitis mediator]
MKSNLFRIISATGLGITASLLLPQEYISISIYFMFILFEIYFLYSCVSSFHLIKEKEIFKSDSYFEAKKEERATIDPRDDYSKFLAQLCVEEFILITTILSVPSIESFNLIAVNGRNILFFFAIKCFLSFSVSMTVIPLMYNIPSLIKNCHTKKKDSL